MKSITLKIERRPKAKARPRHNKKGQVFTPKATTDEEKAIRAAWQQAELETLEGPVEVSLTYTPECSIITVQESPHDATTLRGDIDNYVKLTLDALNGTAWVDDKQVVRISAVKVNKIDSD